MTPWYNVPVSGIISPLRTSKEEQQAAQNQNSYFIPSEKLNTLVCEVDHTGHRQATDPIACPRRMTIKVTKVLKRQDWAGGASSLNQTMSWLRNGQLRVGPGGFPFSPALQHAGMKGQAVGSSRDGKLEASWVFGSEGKMFSVLIKTVPMWNVCIHEFWVLSLRYTVRKRQCSAFRTWLLLSDGRFGPGGVCVPRLSVEIVWCGMLP